MTNREKYKLNSRMILENVCEGKLWYCRFVQKHILKRDNCDNVNCNDCKATFVLWLDEEAEEDAVDWSKVKQGTGIEVSDDKRIWSERVFLAEYKGRIYATNESDICFAWKYGRLLKDGDKNVN